MGGSTRTSRASDAAQAAGSNPYVRRLIEDQELRENLRVAFNAAKDAYARMSNGKGPARTLVDDKKVHKDLRTAAESLREASEQLRGKRNKRRGGLGRLLLIGVAAAGLALILSEDLRKTVLDRLFGAEEEFEYSSTTTATESEAAPV